MGIVSRHLDHSEHCRVMRVIKHIQLRILTVDRQSILGQVICTNAEEINFLRQLTADHYRSRCLDHDTKLHIFLERDPLISEFFLHLSDDLFEVLSLAQKLAKDSNGAFDVTIGNLTQLWRKARKTGILPTKEELLHAQSLSGWEHLTLDVKHQTGTLNRSGIRLDLGGIGKGFAADKAIELLRQHGVKNAFIAASGDIRVIGAPPGEPGWKIQIETFSQSPEEVGNYIIYLTDAAISTSGDVNQFVEIEGKRYSHIIDIETGLGLTRRSGATVIHSQAAYCDALATLACILEPEEAIQFLKKHNAKLRLIYIDSDNKKQILTTSNFPEALSD